MARYLLSQSMVDGRRRDLAQERLRRGDELAYGTAHATRHGSAVFFTSRRRHTRSLCDWSSDVCSSDLTTFSFYGDTNDPITFSQLKSIAYPDGYWEKRLYDHDNFLGALQYVLHPWKSTPTRSEERRVGKECRSRWSPYH